MSYKGLQQYCYNLGYDHAQLQMPDPVGEAIAVAPCTFVESANKAYGQGIVDGMNPAVKSALGIKSSSEVQKTG